MAGDQEIASFYNLLHKGVIYFYLGGMETETDNRLKPGLLGHTLCIEDYRHHGFHYYDFMGGEERYKANLGQLHRQLTQVSLQRGRFKLKLEDVARRTKQLWLKETAPNER
jgi:CelD/BcsL family acetyltransferase involved in cellulose biosynthesis